MPPLPQLRPLKVPGLASGGLQPPEVGSNFIGASGSGGSGGSGSGGSGGPTLNVPIYGTPPTGGSDFGSGTSSGSFLSSTLGALFGNSLLRIAFFLLGLICIIGAIYLYKPSVVTTPLKMARDGAAGAIAA